MERITHTMRREYWKTIIKECNESGMKKKDWLLNEKGSVLPSTGGVGTTVFYIIGSALVLGAGVLLAAKKKAAN